MKKFIIVICAGCLLAIAGFIGAKKQVDYYVGRLNSANPVISNHAITRLGALGRRHTAPALRKFLSREYQHDTRLLAVQALGNLGDAGSVELIIPILAEPDAGLKLAAAEALGKIRDQRGIVPLAGMLSDQDAQLTAIWALGNIGHTNAIPFLTGLLTSQDKFVRYNVSQALKKIGPGT